MKKKLLGVFSGIFFRFIAIGLGLYINRWLDGNLSVQDYANYNLILVYNSVLIGILILGIPSLVQKFYTLETDHSKHKDFITTIFILQSFLYLVGVALIFIISYIFNLNYILMFLGLFTVQYLLVLDLNFRSITDSFGKIWQYSLSDIVNKFIIVGFLFSSFFINFTLNEIYIFIFAALIASFVKIIFNIFLQHKYIGLGKFNFSIIKQNAPFLFNIGLASFIASLYLSTDKWMINLFGYSNEALNGYANAYKIMDIAVVVLSLTIPMIASYAKKESVSEEMSNTINQKIMSFKLSRFLPKLFWKDPLNKWMFLSFMIGFTMFVLTLVSSTFIIRLLYTNDLYYSYAEKSLFLLSFFLIFYGVLFFAGIYSLFIGGEKYELRISIINATISLILYVILISQFSYIGAAVANVFGVFIYFLIRMFYFKKLRLENSASNI